MTPIDIDVKERTSELISREAAIEAIGERPLSWTDTLEELQAIIDWDCYIAAIKSVPTVDAMPVRRGKWNESKCLDECFWICSVCDFPSEASAAPRLYNYCPNCGAKMDKEDSDGQN